MNCERPSVILDDIDRDEFHRSTDAMAKLVDGLPRFDPWTLNDHVRIDPAVESERA